MAMDALDIWINTFKLLPHDPTGLLAPPIITIWVWERVADKLACSLIKFLPEILFKWQSNIFLAAFWPICITPAPFIVIPAGLIADAWKNSIMASTFFISEQSLLTSSVSYFPTYGTNGVLGSAAIVIDPASIITGANILFTMISTATPYTLDIMPRALFYAFSALTVTITGVDTTPTPAGPLPLSVTSCPVI